MPGQPRRRTVTAKTANYSVVFPSDNGVTFTNRGATGAVTFTLPAVTTALDGCWAEFYVAADQTVTVAGTAGEFVAFNDLAANSLAFSTSSEKVGSGVRVICDGTSWLTFPVLGAETATPTIAT